MEAIKVNTNVSQYQRNVAMDFGAYRAIAEGIEKLKSITSDIPWDELYDALESGDLRTAMAKYWAKKTLKDWDNIGVRNELKQQFSYLPGATSFPKYFVTRQPSGAFDVSMEAIRAENLKVYERTIEPEQAEAANQLFDILNKLKLNPYNFNSYCLIDSAGKAFPNWVALADVIGHR